jgi:hypothetical protein
LVLCSSSFVLRLLEVVILELRVDGIIGEGRVCNSSYDLALYGKFRFFQKSPTHHTMGQAAADGNWITSEIPTEIGGSDEF